MREIGVKELKATLSEALRAAESGERITVTKHGRAIAEFGPPRTAETPDQQMQRLIAEGLVKPATKPVPQQEPPLYKAESPASDFIFAEREAER